MLESQLTSATLQKTQSPKLEEFGVWEFRGFRSLPIGSIVVPFWDYLIGFYI